MWRFDQRQGRSAPTRLAALTSPNYTPYPLAAEFRLANGLWNRLEKRSRWNINRSFDKFKFKFYRSQKRLNALSHQSPVIYDVGRINSWSPSLRPEASQESSGSTDIFSRERLVIYRDYFRGSTRSRLVCLNYKNWPTTTTFLSSRALCSPPLLIKPPNPIIFIWRILKYFDSYSIIFCIVIQKFVN